MQPTEDAPLPVALLRLVHDIASVFQRGWQAGTPPQLEHLVGSVAVEARAALFRQLLPVEIAFRLQQLRPVSADEAALRFAGLGDWVEAILAEHGIELAGAHLTLRVTAGPHLGESFRLRGHNTFLLGRGDKVHLALPQDLQLSRLHLMVEFNPPSARVADAGSKHGTFVNGVRVDRGDLNDGDEISAGQSVLRVELVRISREDTDNGSPEGDNFTTALPARPSSGQPMVGDYAIEGKLGEGGMGVVYRARRQSDGLLVALKMVQPAMLPRSSILSRFQREMAILGQLQHPHIVRFLEAGEASGMLYFVMEYVDGPSTADVVKRVGPMPAKRVVALGCQLLEALAHAHDLGFVHRDIKPGNLLLARQSEPTGEEMLKLADFGMARTYQASALSGLTLSGTAGGTAPFMPPEQVTDFRSAKPPADQYGAAATLYYLLTGEHIYERSRSNIELMQRILSNEPIPLREAKAGPALPEALGQVLRRSLQRQPERRYADVREMREELARAL